MIHLGPLLEGGGGLGEVVDAAIADAQCLAAAGFDGAMIENFGDRPFHPEGVEPHTIAAMARIAAAVQLAVVDARGSDGGPFRLGINVLRNDVRSAVAIAAAVGAHLVRVNVHIGAAVTDQGILQGRAHETIRYRDRIAPGVAVLADVQVKHAAPVAARPLQEEAEETFHRGRADGLIVSGSRTGGTTDPSHVAAVRAAVPERCPVWIGSGASVESVAALAAHADGFIVGTSIKAGGDVLAAVDPDRARAFIDALRACG